MCARMVLRVTAVGIAPNFEVDRPRPGGQSGPFMQKVAETLAKYKRHTSGTYPVFVYNGHTSVRDSSRIRDLRSRTSIGNVPDLRE